MTLSHATIVRIAYGIAVAAVFAAGCFVRLSGEGSHVDENYIIEAVERMVRDDTWNPNRHHWWGYNHPNHITMYADRVLFSSLSVFHFDKPLAETLAANKEYYMNAARTLNEVLACLELLIVFLIARTFSRRAGLVALMLYAIFPTAIRYGHLVRPDTAFTLFSLGTMYALIRYTESSGMRWLVAAAAFAALSTAVKYPGLLNILVIFGVIYARHDRSWRRIAHDVLVVACVAEIVLFMVSPYLFFEFEKVLRSLKFEARTSHGNMVILGSGGNLRYYLSVFSLENGVILSFLGLAGFVPLVRCFGKRALPLALGYVQWTALSLLSLHWERWGTVFYASMIIIASVAFFLTVDRIKKAAYVPVFLRRAALGLCLIFMANLLLDKSQHLTARLAMF